MYISMTILKKRVKTGKYNPQFKVHPAASNPGANAKTPCLYILPDQTQHGVFKLTGLKTC